MNLGVLSLDTNGQPIGNVSYFPDTDPRNPEYKLPYDSISSVIKIIEDYNHNKLYTITRSSLYNI